MVAREIMESRASGAVQSERLSAMSIAWRRLVVNRPGQAGAFPIGACRWARPAGMPFDGRTMT